jgi:multiple antibiotic resistance protein
MSETWSFFVAALSTIFVIVEPFGVVPAFAAMTAGRPALDVRKIALRASVVGAAVLFLFAIGGRLLLDLLGVRIDAFRMAGGLLLLLTALDMLRAKQVACRCSKEELEDAKAKDDIAVVPLAIPLLSGPGAMAAVMMLMSRASGGGQVGAVLLAIAITFVVSFVVLRSASAISSAVGPSVMAAVQRVLGLVLGAMSLQFIVEGGVNLLASLKG